MTDTSRRSLLTGTAAALAGGAAVNLAAITIAKADLSPRGETSDPIFELIARHKVLYDAVEASVYGSSFEEQDRLATEVEKVNQARDAILAAPFTTMPGVAAALRFLMEYELDAYDYTEHGEAFLRRLADAIERMAVRA